VLPSQQTIFRFLLVEEKNDVNLYLFYDECPMIGLQTGDRHFFFLVCLSRSTANCRDYWLFLSCENRFLLFLVVVEDILSLAIISL